MNNLFLSNYLALKEIWRNRGRFFLLSLVIALITLLVLFIAALGEGLSTNNREYISKLDGQLVVFSDKSDYIISASRLSDTTLRAIWRVDGVEDAGPLSISSTAIVQPDDQVLKVSLLGVETGRPATPAIIMGRSFRTDQSTEVIVDERVIQATNIKLGDEITLRSTQGTKDKFYNLTVVGVTGGQAYLFQPSIFIPNNIWERVRPKSESEIDNLTPAINVIIIKLTNPSHVQEMKQKLQQSIQNIQVADIQTTINNIPGYTAQQGTVQTQGFFTLLIGVLVIGGFFQIQILQKVPQIGVLKAIGASNFVVGFASIIQINIVTSIGVAIGGLLTFLLSLGFPPSIPLYFNGFSSALAIFALLSIGPLGGLVSVFYAIKIEPLKALRLL